MDAPAVERTLVRIAHQIIEKNNGTDDLCFIGIKTRGVPLAERLAANIKQIDGANIPIGELDITLHRDDLRAEDNPKISDTKISFDINGKTVILVDDVIYTGRTARAALDATMAIGRPSRIQLFAMIDRGHSELPIKANYVGKNIPTAKTEIVSVQLNETDGKTGIYIFEKI